MASGTGFKLRHLVLLELILVTMSRFYSGCFALVAPSKLPSRLQQRIGAKTFSLSSSAENTFDSSTLLEPKAVSSKVFSDDKRPVILFDGGR